MPQPRSYQIDPESTPYYHCITRCVRGSFLCGIDKSTGVDYTYRKKWIENKIIELSKAFAIQLCEYSIMETHHHLILMINEKESHSWSDAEVYKRWHQVYPQNAEFHKNVTSDFNSKAGKERIAIWKERLCSISWYMKALNEAIAKRANSEEGAKGKFWDARFKCVPLLDERALLTAMAYVALNPVRAKMASTPEKSDFTGFKRRFDCTKKQMSKKGLIGSKFVNSQSIDKLAQPSCLMPFRVVSNDETEPSIPLSLSDYYKLVDSTGRIVRKDKRGSIGSQLASILERLNISSSHWVDLMHVYEENFKSAVGAEILLVNFGKKRQRGVKGMGAARKYFNNSANIQNTNEKRALIR